MTYTLLMIIKVKIGNNQEIAQSERSSHSKIRGGKNKAKNQALILRKHIASRVNSYFLNKWPHSHPNLTKNEIIHVTPRHKTIITTTKVSPLNDQLYKITGGLNSTLQPQFHVVFPFVLCFGVDVLYYLNLKYVFIFLFKLG